MPVTAERRGIPLSGSEMSIETVAETMSWPDSTTNCSSADPMAGIPTCRRAGGEKAVNDSAVGPTSAKDDGRGFFA